MALFAAAAEAGDRQAAFEVGECYFHGKGTLRHPASAARWYQRAAEAGHERAQCRLAQLYLFGLPKDAIGPSVGLFEPPATGADYAMALLWAERAAEAGDAEAQAMLGYIFTEGPEALRDPDAAFRWYAKSAAQDWPQGRLGYGIALMLEADSAEEMQAARDEFLRAAEGGLLAVHYLLGLGAERGSGMAPDLAQAREHFQIAAEAGLTASQARLGLLLLEGRGGPVDQLNGESWLRRAALGGDAAAAASLGDLYARADDSAA